ncbi:hypothetical protein [Sinomonas halotolerans]|uniref:Uncharacterized protein n=1 Tax=Sinomonas halotolerans TaxID=1644133 RepID=A0ABU9WVN2_9MICC
MKKAPAPRPCPYCGAESRPIAYGMPASSEDAETLRAEGWVIGGCVMMADEYGMTADFQCLAGCGRQWSSQSVQRSG